MILLSDVVFVRNITNRSGKQEKVKLYWRWEWWLCSLEVTCCVCRSGFVLQAWLCVVLQARLCVSGRSVFKARPRIVAQVFSFKPGHVSQSSSGSLPGRAVCTLGRTLVSKFYSLRYKICWTEGWLACLIEEGRWGGLAMPGRSGRLE